MPEEWAIDLLTYGAVLFRGRFRPKFFIAGVTVEKTLRRDEHLGTLGGGAVVVAL